MNSHISFSPLMSIFRALLGVLLVTGTLQAQGQKIQVDSCHILMIANVQTDSIVLRWAPDLAIVWKMQLPVGYIVERALIPADSSTRALVFERLTSAPLLPYTYEQFGKAFTPADKFAGVAAELMYSTKTVQVTDIGNAEEVSDAGNELKMRHSFSLFAADQDARVATASGLRFVDKTYTPGAGYLYRVFYATSPEGIACDTALLYVNTRELTPVPLMRSPEITTGDSKLVLRWRADAFAGFNGYYIERAAAGSTQFKRLNSLPFVATQQENDPSGNAFFTDSVQNYIRYSYRLIGITAFGTLSEPSQTVSAMARDLTAPHAALITGVKDTGKNQLVIQWQLPTISPDLASLQVAHSFNNDGPFEAISSPLTINERSFTHVSPDPYRGNFYILMSRDTAGNTSRSLPFYGILTDSFPPLVPQGLTGFIDTNSVVHLSWNAGAERDLQGYRVFFANAPDHEFSNLTQKPINATVYNDTIVKRTLTKHIYYRIAAVDNNYNHSAVSPWIKIRRLDIIPPDAPVLKNVFVKDSTIELSWHNSSSDDVAMHLLLRRAAGEKDWKTIAQWEGYPSKTDFVDVNTIPKTYYEYTMLARDSSNLVSENAPVLAVRAYDSGRRPGIEQFRVVYNAEKKMNEIQWTYAPAGNYSFLIYRSYQNFGLAKYASIERGLRAFIDRDLVGSGTYTYAIKVVYVDGGESPMTDKVQVVID